MPSNSLVKCEGITKTYGFFRKHIALNNVNLEIKKGEIVCIVGPNGAGKSTLIKILSNVIENYTGKISISANIRYVPENSVFFPNLTGFENLRYYARISGRTDDDIQKIMKKLDLQDSKIIANGFSKGMKRKLDIARALIYESNILIMDEPFDGLEPKICDELISILLELRSTGYSFLISSHELSKVEKLADRILFLNDGMIKTEENLKNNNYVYVEYENDENVWEGLEEKDIEIIERSDRNAILKISQSMRQWEIISLLISRGLKVTAFSKESLESLYRRIYER